MKRSHRMEKLRDTAAQALDIAISMQAPAFGKDRAAHREQVDELRRLSATLRRARTPSARPELPTEKQVLQLSDLGGRDFVRLRERVAKQLQRYLDAVDEQPREAPAAVRDAIRQIARADAQPILQDADEAWRAFHAGSYKASVVMAGATLEGALQAALARIGSPAESAFLRVFPRRKQPPDADSYRFDEALSVLREMGVITSAISHVARGVKELRNFVHPAVQKRQRGRVTDTRALLALQAVATLVEEVAERLDFD
jgi:hypothetical protein